jgi:DnaK suppressor protein
MGLCPQPLLCIIRRFTRLSGLRTHACSKATGQQSQDFSEDQAGILHGQDSCRRPQDCQQGSARTSPGKSKAGGEIHSEARKEEACDEAGQGTRGQPKHGKESPKGRSRHAVRCKDGHPQSRYQHHLQILATAPDSYEYDPNALIHGIRPYKPKAGESYMNAAQLEHFRQVLLAWKRELMEEVDRTVHHMQDEASNFPDPNDRATQESEFGLELRTRDRERKLLKKIASALARIDDNSYGYCEETGEEIGLKRLEARPVATLCLEAQERRELAEKTVRRTRRPAQMTGYGLIYLAISP